MESEAGHLSELYYLVDWKDYLKEKKYIATNLGDATSSKAAQQVLSKEPHQIDNNFFPS